MSTPAEARLASREQLLAIIQIQSEIAKLGLDLSGVMELVVERCLSLVRAEGAAIELADGEEMVYRAASGMAAGQLGLRLNIHGSLSGLCVRCGLVLRCDDSETDERVDRAACRRVGVRSMLVLPLKYRESCVGVLKVMSPRPAAFGDTAQVLLALLTELLGAEMFFAAKYAANDLFHRATHDELTGLANRALFLDRLRNRLAQARRDGDMAGVLMLDLDGLKPINDQFGHRAGDAAISTCAERLKGAVRQCDTAARLGGDEFAVLLQRVEGEAALHDSVRRLREAICRPFAFEQTELPLQISIGAALIPAEGSELEAVLDCADQAMYRDKRQRKARVPAAT